ncbi:hypothetical protein QOZ80_2AG0141800 [Eleusine coracana subsp. coracana]|nr:hypothetical protein QOZ80_2AG0141800 [Eleusine coracana subsp. coracana]
MVGTVKVHNVSLKASEQDIKEFFSFSGDIVHVEMKSCDERSQFAYISFRDNQGAERAMLLTGATIAEMAVIITPATDYQVPAAILADLESRNAGGMESALRKAEDVVGSMLAKGFVLGMDAVEKAKAFDEKHQLTSTATAKVSDLDRSMGLSQKFSTGTLVVNEKMKEMDEKYQVAEKTKLALAAAEQTVSTAGSAIMSNRYVLTGAAWVTGAYSKVATTAADGGTKANEGEHLDGELAKTHLHEGSEAVEQECKNQEGDSTSARNFVLENPEIAQPENEHQDLPEGTEIVKQEEKDQEGETEISHVEESAEIGEEPKHHETESSKVNMAGQSEEPKHPDGQSATTHVSGSPVTIPVDSTNTPEKPESAQGFV